MLKLTRLNNTTVAINPDHVMLVDVIPDTIIRMVNGDRIIVRESLDELISIYITLRQKIHSVGPGVCPLGRTDGEVPTIAADLTDGRDD